jgi:hypothetical protein
MGADGSRISSVQLEIECLIIVGLYQYAVKADMKNRKSGKLQREHCEPFRPPAMFR